MTRLINAKEAKIIRERAKKGKLSKDLEVIVPKNKRKRDSQVTPRIRQMVEAQLRRKDTPLIKDVFAQAFADLQTNPNLELKTWAAANPTAFYTLCTKLIPTQLTGEGGGPLEVRNVTFE